MPDPDVVVAAFTALAPDYEPTVDRELRMFWGVSYRDFLARLLDLATVADDEAVLDIATGTAFLPSQIAGQMSERGHIYGLDITPAMLVHGAERIEAAGHQERTRLVCGSALAIPTASQCLDVALCALGTHHIDVTGLVSEMQRVVRPGGRVVLADVCANPFWRSLAGAILLRCLVIGYGLALRSDRARAEVEAFDNVRTPGEWRTLLMANGFTDVTLQEVRPRFPWYPGGFIARAVRC